MSDVGRRKEGAGKTGELPLFCKDWVFNFANGKAENGYFREACPAAGPEGDAAMAGLMK